MRSRLMVAMAIVSLALLIPAAALGAKPAATSKQDTAVAYFINGDDCAILTLWQGTYRPLNSNQFVVGQGYDVQLGTLDGDACVPSAADGAPLDPADFRIIGLNAAFLVSSITIDGHDVDLDVSWVAVGTPTYATEQHDDWSFVGKEVAAHVTGVIAVDGSTWVAQPGSAILRSFSISKNF